MGPMTWGRANSRKAGPLRPLVVEMACERLALPLVRELNGDNDRISVLITCEPSWLVPMAIEPFAHRRHLARKIRGVHSNRNSAHFTVLPAGAPPR